MSRFYALMLLFAMPFARTEAQTYTCRVASDSLAIELKDWVVTLVTATDPKFSAKRTAYVLPTTTANKVSVVGSGTTCNAAGGAYHAAVKPGTPAISRNLILIKVSTTHFVVQDPEELSDGEFAPTVVFNKNWGKLSAWDS